MRRLAWWGALIGLVAVAVPIATRATGFEPGQLALVVAFMPWITLACLVPLALAIVARGWILAGLAGLCLALCLVWIAPLYVGGGGGGEPAVTVATVNMTVGGADADAVVSMVREHHIDVLVAVELTPSAAQALDDAGLGDELGYGEVFAEPGVPGTGLYSRLPLSDAEDVPGFTAHTIHATITGPVGEFTMFAIHPQAPGKRNHDNWAADLDRLAEVLGAETGPVVVAGDFNTTRDQSGFRAIEGLGYVDAADRIDAGFRPTYPANGRVFALFAIDHVMTRDVPLRPATFDLVNVPTSDHLALVVGFAASGGP